ncbi:rhomboid family intramembrane serine protease, partial [Candidatus Gracilibacteria bacterium]|nr:rhomboid family intramembrane serine protease [Candidatus Gracilibacteria bacterium]
MQNRFTISNIFLFLSVVATLAATVFSDFNIYFNWGVNSYFLEEGNYIHFILQFFTGTFLHGGILHLAMNSIFILYFGNIVEIMLGRKKYITFFLFTVIFIGIGLALFVPYQNTVGISGFALALLTYYTLELWGQKNPEYTGGITAIILNVGIGFYPGISLYGHLFGVIAGVIFYFFHRNFFGKQEIGFMKNYKKFIKKIPKA